ncbi:MAG: egsA 1 [Paenibacillaceae bacterium]|nr:egsA 1 [Paenibacillaceae bacterium]
MINNTITYGSGLVREAVAGLSDYVVVTSRTPWRLFGERFNPQPAKVVFPESLEKTYLDELSATLPMEIDIVGLGGGAALDQAKYLAYLRNRTPVLFPTLTSSNTPFSDFISVRRSGKPFGFKQDGWPRKVFVDFELIRQGDARMNRAGYGDLLFMMTTLEDWRLSAARGIGAPYEEAVGNEVTRLMEQTAGFASEVGALSDIGIERLMRAFAASTEIIARHPHLPLDCGSEHLYCWQQESLVKSDFIHGELVALGMIIVSYLQGKGQETIRAALDRAGVIYRPRQLGLDWEDIQRTLLTVEAYNKEYRKLNTVFAAVEWTPELLGEIRAFLFGS